ncbi:MAG: hypothetical protein ACYDB7_15885, partial [Mycobacteriales bacterium]
GESRIRRERGVSRGLSASQAAGRPRPGEVAASAITREFLGMPIREHGGTRLIDVTPRDAGQASRVGRYLADVGQLVAGQLPAAAFADRWRGRHIAGHAAEWDAGRIMTILSQQGPEPGAVRYRRVVPGAAA